MLLSAQKVYDRIRCVLRNQQPMYKTIGVRHPGASNEASPFTLQPFPPWATSAAYLPDLDNPRGVVRAVSPPQPTTSPAVSYCKLCWDWTEIPYAQHLLPSGTGTPDPSPTPLPLPLPGGALQC